VTICVVRRITCPIFDLESETSQTILIISIFNGHDDISPRNSVQ
jgi:hypothetical protein